MSNEVVLYRVNGDRNILLAIKRRKADNTGRSLRRNCLVKHIIGGNIQLMGRRGKRRKKLLNNRKEMRGCWKLKREN